MVKPIKIVKIHVKKQYTRAPKKIRQVFKNRRNLFLKNPFDSILHNHQLSGELRKYRSINITGDWRVFYSENEFIIFKGFGTHSQLYK